MPPPRRLPRSGSAWCARRSNRPRCSTSSASPTRRRGWCGSIPGTGRPARPRGSTRSCCPDSLHFAEYNAESPAGLGYTQRLCELFDALPVMARFREGRGVRFNPTIAPMLEALLASYREWGGTAAPPTMAIVDWRNVPTWTEFEILRDAFVEAGVPTVVCAPRICRSTARR